MLNLGAEKTVILNLFGWYVEEIVLLLGIEVIAAVSFIVGWVLYNKNRFTAYICEPYHGTFKIKRKFRISMINTDFRWKDKAYNINFKYAFIDEKNKPVLFYNVGVATPILPLRGMGIKADDKLIDSKLFKVGLDGDVMKHLSSRRVEKMFWYIIIGLVLTIMVIGVYSIYSMTQTNEQILYLTNRMLNITKSILSKPIIIP